MIVQHNYGEIRRELENFLPLVGNKVMELRRNAESNPNFAVLKADKTIVTQADTASEDLIRAWIEERFPDDSIRGEERERKIGGPHTWIIDPIDGTYNYNHHGAMFSISVGLVESNIPKVGVLHFPAENINLSAVKGGGVLMDEQSLISGEGRKVFSEAQVCIQSTQLHLEYFSQPKFAKTLVQQARLPLKPLVIEGADTSFTYTFLQLVRQSSIDAIMHPGATPYDIGAICAIAKELGWTFSGYDGEAVDFAKDTISIVIVRNASLRKEIIKNMKIGN